MLAEELSVDPDFALWFVEAALANCGVSLPGGVPSRVDVRFNVWDDVAGVDDAGENDVDVVLWWGNHREPPTSPTLCGALGPGTGGL